MLLDYTNPGQDPRFEMACENGEVPLIQLGANARISEIAVRHLLLDNLFSNALKATTAPMARFAQDILNSNPFVSEHFLRRFENREETMLMPLWEWSPTML